MSVLNIRRFVATPYCVFPNISFGCQYFLLISRSRAGILAEVLSANSSEVVGRSRHTTDPQPTMHPPPSSSFPTQTSTIDQTALVASLSIPHKSRSSNGSSAPKSSFEAKSAYQFENPYKSRRESWPELKTPTETKKSSDPCDPTVFNATGHFADVDNALKRLVEYERQSGRTMERFYAEREYIVKERTSVAEEIQRKEKVVGYDRARDPRLQATDPRLRPLG